VYDQIVGAYDKFEICSCDICKQDQVSDVNNYGQIVTTRHEFEMCSCDICKQDQVSDVNSYGQPVATCDELVLCSCDICKQDPVLNVRNYSNTVSSNNKTGGFRLKMGETLSTVENITESKCDFPLTELQEFYVQAHDVISKSGVPNCKGARIPIPTHLNVTAWETQLQGYSDEELLEFLKYGFPVGYEKKELPISKLKNHKGAVDYPEFINDYINKELSEELLLGPFHGNPLSVPVSISPLNTVPKKVPTDRRVIADFSYPEGSAVNDGICKNTYLGNEVDLSYPTVDDLAALLKTLGPGCKIFKKDLKKAYRQFKIDPGDIHLSGYFWNNSVYLDLALVMGARSAAFLCQRVTDAVRYIAKNAGVTVLNYLDDICAISDPQSADEKFVKITQILSELGLQESVEKSVHPATRVEFLGVLFDTECQTMEVTPERLVEIRDLVDHWLSKKRASKRELQSLIGKLVFISRCVYGSRIFISRLLVTLRSLKKQNHRFKLGGEFKKDLYWWQKFLSMFNGVNYIPDMVWAAPDVHMSTDACMSGAGGWSGKEYFYCAFPQFVLDENTHINQLELITIMVGLRIWSEKFVNTRIQVYCDNNSSVVVLNSGRTKDHKMLEIIREIAFLSAKYNYQVKAVHLPGVTNRIADKLSRASTDCCINIEDVVGVDWCEYKVKPSDFRIVNPW